MAGTPQQPYGPPQQPMPQFSPHVGRQPGGTAPKVWGVLLLVLGFLGLVFMAMNVASMFGGGLKASMFGFNLSPEAKVEIDKLVADVAAASMNQWSTWANLAAELVIAILSLIAGFLLVVKPRPVGRKLALARALLVLLALPLYGLASVDKADMSNELTERTQRIMVDDMARQEEARSPSKNDEEREKRRTDMLRQVQMMQPVTEAAQYAGVAVVGLGILIINGLLLFFMTRPAVKEYLESVASGGDHAIPGYDPSMGFASGPPPGSAQPPHGS